MIFLKALIDQKILVLDDEETSVRESRSKNYQRVLTKEELAKFLDT